MCLQSLTTVQDGTLTDSIAAVEAAWTAKAHELGLEPKAVIKATHGRRASDNLMDLVPGLKKEHVEREVDRKCLSFFPIDEVLTSQKASSAPSWTLPTRLLSLARTPCRPLRDPHLCGVLSRARPCRLWAP